MIQYLRHFDIFSVRIREFNRNGDKCLDIYGSRDQSSELFCRSKDLLDMFVGLLCRYLYQIVDCWILIFISFW